MGSSRVNVTEGKVDGGVGIAWEGNHISSLSHPAASEDSCEVLTARAKNTFVCPHLPVAHFECDISSDFLEKHFQQIFAESSRLAARNR